MANSKYPTTQYSSSSFVESAGTILFSHHEPFSHYGTTSTSNIRPLKVCLLHYLPKDEFLLPKGRRDIAESRADAALRETREETGCKCSMLPVKMGTRCTLPGETNAGDRVRKETVQGEAFFVTHRELGEGKGIKIIWWFVAVADEGEDGRLARVIEGQFKPFWISVDEVLEKVTFKEDRAIVEKAIELVTGKESEGVR